MTPNHFRLALGMALLVFALAYSSVHIFRESSPGRFGPVIHEARSDFSHIRIREIGSVRSLLFVDERGTELRQSSLDLASPGTNQLGYTGALFSSLLFCPSQNRVLIVGLGGGGMVQFLNRAFPAMTVEAVEIDPVVVALAAEYFLTVSGPKTKIHTRDAFAFFEEDHGGYDAIYMDAFLRPPSDSDLHEKTARLKTEDFLKTLRTHLNPGGVVAFNLLRSDPGTPDDIAAIESSFPATYLFEVPRSGNLVLIASLEDPGPTPAEIRTRAKSLDEELPVGLSFESLVRNL